MGVTHYENFPVASVLLPKRLRRPVQLIYAFARSADDFADEGDMTNEARLSRLDQYRQQLDAIERNETLKQPLFAELAPMISAHRLPLELFRDLLSAFSQDVTKNRYANFGEVMDYCRRSANPIGRLLLHLYQAAHPRNLALSDGICSSLQLINFLQDIEIDFRKNRVYLPQDELQLFSVSEDQIARQHANGNWRAFMFYQIDRARRMLQAGAPLGSALPGRIGLELRMIVMGGERILKKLHDRGGDIYRFRPVLRPMDWVYMLYRSLIVQS